MFRFLSVGITLCLSGFRFLHPRWKHRSLVFVQLFALLEHPPLMMMDGLQMTMKRCGGVGGGIQDPMADVTRCHIAFRRSLEEIKDWGSLTASFKICGTDRLGSGGFRCSLSCLTVADVVPRSIGLFCFLVVTGGIATYEDHGRWFGKITNNLLI